MAGFSRFPDPSQLVVLRAGWIFGNVEGYTSGVEVKFNADETITFTIRADFTERYVNVALECVEIGPELNRG